MNKIIVTVLIFLVSCSHTSVVMKKEHMIPYEDFSTKTLAPFDSATIKIVEVIDFRKNTQDLGVARTGVQYKETPVKLNTKLEHYISNYYRTALLDRRLNIVEENAKYELTIKINELWLEEQAQKMPERVRCNANFTFELKGKNRSIQTNIWNEVLSPGDMADGTTKLEPTFSSCLNLIAEKLVTSQKFLTFIKE